MTRVSSCMDSRGIRAVIGRQCKLRKTTTQICSDVERTAPTAPSARWLPARPPRLNQGGEKPACDVTELRSGNRPECLQYSHYVRTSFATFDPPADVPRVGNERGSRCTSEECIYANTGISEGRDHPDGPQRLRSRGVGRRRHAFP